MNERHLIYPTLNLFLYDLQDNFGQESRKIDLNRRQFWRKFDAELDKKLKEIAEVNPQLDRTKLEISGELTLGLRQQLQGLGERENSGLDYVQLYSQSFDEEESDFNGNYCALQLGDTYALQVDCYEVTEKREAINGINTAQNLAKLRELKSRLIAKINHHSDRTEIDANKQGTLGQTWLIWGKLTNNHQNPKDVAEECYMQLTPNPTWKPNCTQSGQLFGGTVFEYWQAPNHWVLEGQQLFDESYHLIVCIFPCSAPSNEVLRKTMKGVYLDLTKLFCDRHKVIWAYWKSRILMRQLKDRMYKMNELIADIENLESPQIDFDLLQSKLIKYLPSVSQYAVDLTRLATHSRTIAINLKNYKKRLKKLEKNANTDLDNLRDFTDLAEERYLQQVDMDRASLNSGLTLLENVIRTIGSVVDIEQTKGDRDLTFTVGVASLGLAVCGITATVVSARQPPPKDIFFMKTPAFGWSIAVAVPFILAWLIRRYRR